MKNVLPYLRSSFKFLVALLFAGIFLPQIATAQPQTFFYRAWVHTGDTYTPNIARPVVTKVNGAGQTFIARSVLNSSSTYSMVLTKYNTSGTTAWASTFNVNNGGDVYIGAMAFDASGNILVTGSAYNGTTNNYDLFVVKYNSSGTKLWHQLHNGPANSYDFGAAVNCDSNGDVYVTGGAFHTALNPNVVTIRYNSSGTALWTQTWDNASLADAGGNIAFSTSTTITVTGFTQVSASVWEYVALSYLRSTGNLQSANVTNLGGTTIDRVSAVAFDASGNTYIAGTLGTSGQGLNIKTIKFGTSLNILWTANWNGAANLDDAANAIVVDASGNVYVAGYTTTTAGRDAILLKYTSGGSTSTAQNYDSGGDDAFQSLAFTSDGGLFAAGYASPKGNKDCFSAFYLSGSLRWQETYNGYANGNDEIKQLTSDGADGFFADGPSVQQDGSTANQTIHYTRHTLLTPQNETVNAPFIENRGQLLDTDERPADDVRYYTRSNYPNVYLSDDRASFVFAHIDTSATTQDTMTRLDLTFESHGSGGGATIAVGLERQEDFHNYYLGHIPEGRERVPLENKVLHPDIYSNIDAMYGLGQDGFFMRLICKPGGNPGHIQMRFTGQTAISIQTDGSLRVETALEDLILAKPTALFSNASGVESAPSWDPAFVLNTDGSVGLSVGSIPSGSSLIVKTGRGRNGDYEAASWWSTYYGWTGFDTETAVDFDQTRQIYTCGQSRSQNFPVGNFVLSAQGESDWTINKFSISGVPIWFTMLGGSGVGNGDFRERAHDISVGAEEYLYVGGAAVEWDPNMFKNPNGGHHDTNFGNIPLTRGAIVRMTKNSGALEWATYFGDGGKLHEDVLGVEAMGNGGVAVVGFAHDIVNAGTWQNVNPGGNAHQQTFGDMYIGTFDASDHLLWATKFGPNNTAPNDANHPADIKEDASNNLFVVGRVISDPSSTDKFPTGGGLAFSSGTDGFAAKFANNRELTWCTYIGGSGTDYCSGVAYDPAHDNIVVLGTTNSTVAQGFPILSLGNPDIDDATMEGGDLFLAKFAINGTMLHSRYFGGEASERTDIFSLAFPELQPCNGIDIEPGGSIFITGAAGVGLPVIWPAPTPPWYFPNHSGGSDSFVAAFASDFKLNYCTYLGSRNDDNGTGIAVTSLGSEPGFVSVMVGRTQIFSDDYPPAQETPLSYFSGVYFGGQFDGIITKIGTPAILVETKEGQVPDTAVKTSPNPCTDALLLQIDGEYIDGPSTVSIYDLTGRLVEQTLIAAGQNQVLVNTRSLTPEVYMIKVSFATGQWSGKFIKSSH